MINHDDLRERKAQITSRSSVNSLENWNRSTSHVVTILSLRPVLEWEPTRGVKRLSDDVFTVVADVLAFGLTIPPCPSTLNSSVRASPWWVCLEKFPASSSRKNFVLSVWRYAFLSDQAWFSSFRQILHGITGAAYGLSLPLGVHRARCVVVTSPDVILLTHNERSRKNEKTWG